MDTFNSIVAQSPKVYWRGSDAAMILCKGHGERRPSLSIRRGDKGILVYCFAGCTLKEVCDAFGVEVCQLFYDFQAGKRHPALRRPHCRYRIRTWKEQAADLEDEALSYHLRGERILDAVKD